MSKRSLLTFLYFLFPEQNGAGVKRKSTADNGTTEKTTPEKKAKVAEEAAPKEADEAAA